MKRILQIAAVTALVMFGSSLQNKISAQFQAEVTTRIFTMTLVLMANGYIIRNTGMYGLLIWDRISVRIVPAGIGYGVMNMNGYGYLIMIGDGLHTIMDAGSMILIMDGFGYRVMNGHLRG
jgi:hypothetical protein